MTTTQTTSDQVRHTIRQLEQRRYDAMVAADLGVLADLLDDRLSYTHSNAQRDTKQSYLAKVGNRTFVYRDIRHPEHELVVGDRVAFVVGEMHADAIISGTPKKLRNAALAVWLQGDDDRWRLAAYQPTPLPAD